MTEEISVFNQEHSFSVSWSMVLFSIPKIGAVLMFLALLNASHAVTMILPPQNGTAGTRRSLFQCPAGTYGTTGFQCNFMFLR